MSIATFTHDQKVLSMKLIKAIQEPQKWGDVLEWIMESVGAKAAIITLRDKENCQIVNDVDLEAKFHSPLIRGFSNEAIIHYLTKLRTSDPWAEFQRKYYPYRPMQMSKVCPPEMIADTAFFNWLSGEGIEDTVVFELDRMSGYWTAINLFLENGNGETAERVHAFAVANFDLLRSAWQTSQSVVRFTQAKNALLHQASSGGAPICLAGANGEFLECNDLFRELLDAGIIRLSGRNRKLSFAESVTIYGIERWEQHELLFHVCDTPPLLILANPVDPDPLFAGKRERLWLLTCSNFAAFNSAPSLAASLNLNVLTPQERKLYDRIKEGRSVSEAGASIGLKRSRSFEIWASVKAKLSIASSHKLR